MRAVATLLADQYMIKSYHHLFIQILQLLLQGAYSRKCYFDANKRTPGCTAILLQQVRIVLCVARVSRQISSRV